MPATACLKKICNREDSGNLGLKGINMHGMWPQDFNGSYPTFCG